MNRKSSFCKEAHYDNARERFKKSLSKYLSFNLFIFIFMILGMGGSFLMKISVIWGAFLALKWYRISDDDNDRGRRNSQNGEDRRSQYGRPRRPDWKDKDLV